MCPLFRSSTVIILISSYNITELGGEKAGLILDENS